METEIIRVSDVTRITGYSRSTIKRKIAANEFPGPIIVTPNDSRWDLAEIRKWIDDRRANPIKKRAFPEPKLVKTAA